MGWVLRVRFYIIVRASEENCQLFPLSLTVSEADVGKEGRNTIHEVEKKQAKKWNPQEEPVSPVSPPIALTLLLLAEETGDSFAIELYMCLTEDSEKLKKSI